MDKKKLVYMSVAAVIIALFTGTVALHMYVAANNLEAVMYDGDKGDLAGAVYGDMVNITGYSSYGALLNRFSNKIYEIGLNDIENPNRIYFVQDRLGVRAATSQRAAKSFAHTFDQGYIQMMIDEGQEVFETSFFVKTRSSGMVLLGSHKSELQIFSFHPESTTIGDDWSNDTVDEEAYDGKVNYESFRSYDYEAIDASALNIAMDGAFADIQDELDTNETEKEYDETANRVILAGFDDLDAAMSETMKAALAKEASVPYSSITLTNYTVNDHYEEIEIAEDLSDAVVEAYEEAEQAAMVGTASFWNKFKEKNPIKVARMQVGAKMNTWKQNAVNRYTQVKEKSVEKARGLTKSVQKLGLSDRLRSGWNKVKMKTGDTLTKLREGTTKFAKKSFSFVGGIFKKYIKFIAIGGIILLIFVFALIYFNRKELAAVAKSAIPM